MKLKIRHNALFKNHSETINWERLRDDKSLPAFYLPFLKEDYVKRVDVSSPSEITNQICYTANKIGLKKIFSVGSGIASQEYQIKKFSKIHVTVSDYTSVILRLKEFDIFDEVLKVDVLESELPIDSSTIVLLPRIDTEFDDENLKKLFAILYSNGVKYIFFIPAELISLKILLAEIKVLIYSKLFNIPKTFCGFARSKKCFFEIWDGYYKLSKEFSLQNQLFVLKRID